MRLQNALIWVYCVTAVCAVSGQTVKPGHFTVHLPGGTTAILPNRPSAQFDSSTGGSNPQYQAQAYQILLQGSQSFINSVQALKNSGASLNQYFQQINSAAANDPFTLNLLHIEENGAMSGQSASQIADNLYAYYKTKYGNDSGAAGIPSTTPLPMEPDPNSTMPNPVAAHIPNFNTPPEVPSGPPDNTPVNPSELTGNEATQAQTIENKDPVMVETSDSDVDPLPKNIQIIKSETDTPTTPADSGENNNIEGEKVGNADTNNQPQNVVQDEEELKPPQSDSDTPTGQIPASLQAGNVEPNNPNQPEIPEAIANENKNVASKDIYDLLYPDLSQDVDGSEAVGDSQRSQELLAQEKALDNLEKMGGKYNAEGSKTVDAFMQGESLVGEVLSKQADTLADYNSADMAKLDKAYDQFNKVREVGPKAAAAAINNTVVEVMGGLALQTATPSQVEAAENADIIKDSACEIVDGAQTVAEKVAENKDGSKSQSASSQGLAPTSSTDAAQSQQSQHNPDVLTQYGTQWLTYSDGSSKDLSSGTFYVSYMGYMWQSNSDGTRINTTLGITILPDGTVIKKPAATAGGVNQ